MKTIFFGYDIHPTNLGESNYSLKHVRKNNSFYVGRGGRVGVETASHVVKI